LNFKGSCLLNIFRYEGGERMEISIKD